jgi:hypothetical protein
VFDLISNNAPITNERYFIIWSNTLDAHLSHFIEAWGIHNKEYPYFCFMSDKVKRVTLRALDLTITRILAAPFFLVYDDLTTVVPKI